MNRRPLRKLKNWAFLALSMLATLAGLACLAAILWTLVSRGLAGMSPRIFTQMTPPPGSAGGLLNALYGSAAMTVLGIVVGSPIGVLAGTYLSEYGQNSRLATAVRFINDVLLSAPSIIIGLFIYEIIVVRMGHFSALAGALSLAVIAIPITLRTTEDMLNLVPAGMKDSSAAMGAYPWRTTMSILYPAARSGIVTGLLLAVARISGETAPLSVHRAQQSVLEQQLERAHGESAGGDFSIRAEPLQGLARPRLGGRADHHRDHFDSERHGPDTARSAAVARRRRSHAMIPSSKLPRHLKTRVPYPRAAPAPADTGPPKIEIRKLDFYYGASQALRNINLALADRSIAAFIGPSGCGKSTLLRVLNRMYALYPHQRAVGEVLIGGRDILGPSVDVADLRYRVGMVFQKPTPFPMSVFDNVAFGLKLAGELRGAELAARVESALTDAAIWDEVKDKLHADGRSLSGGQQQRVCIARTIAVQPEVLLLDEPTAALDPISTLKVEETLQALREKYCIVIVTHNLQQAARVSNVTGFMYMGELVEIGPSNELFTAPKNRRTDDYITGRFG